VKAPARMIPDDGVVARRDDGENTQPPQLTLRRCFCAGARV